MLHFSALCICLAPSTANRSGRCRCHAPSGPSSGPCCFSGCDKKTPSFPPNVVLVVLENGTTRNLGIILRFLPGIILQLKTARHSRCPRLNLRVGGGWTGQMAPGEARRAAEGQSKQVRFLAHSTRLAANRCSALMVRRSEKNMYIYIM